MANRIITYGKAAILFFLFDFEFSTIKAFESSTGKKLNYKIVARRAGDIEKVWADTTFANKELGWKAELGIESMMSSAWKWQEKLTDHQN